MCCDRESRGADFVQSCAGSVDTSLIDKKIVKKLCPCGSGADDRSEMPFVGGVKKRSASSRRNSLDDCLLIEAVDDVDWYSKVVCLRGSAVSPLPAATDSIRRRRRTIGRWKF